MSLRPATSDDLGVIIALIEALAAYEESSDEVTLDPAVLAGHLFGDSPAASVTLAEDEGAVVGFALWFPTFSTWRGEPGIWLEDLFVQPEYRGRGHGTALLQHLATQTSGRIEWSVLDWNTPSIEFYESMGAEPVPGWTRYRWAPADAVPGRS